VRRLTRLNLVYHTDRADAFFDRDDIAAMVAATGRKCDFFKPGFFICSGDDFLPFFPGELISDILVFLQKCNDVKPRNCNRLDQLSLARLWAGYNSRNDKLCVEVDWPDLNRPAKLYAVRTRSRTVIRTRRPLFRLYVPAFVEHRSAIAAEGYVRHVLRPIGIVSSNLAGCAISV